MLTRYFRSKSILFSMLLVFSALFLSGCASDWNYSQKGAVLGTLSGAAIGSAFGPHHGTNAAIGAGAGLIGGYLIGTIMDSNAGN